MSSTKIGEVNGVMVHFPGHQSLEKLLSKLSHTAKFERRKILTMARVPLQLGDGARVLVPFHSTLPLCLLMTMMMTPMTTIKTANKTRTVTFTRFRHSTCLPAAVDHLHCASPWNERMNDSNKQNNQPERKNIQAHRTFEDCQPSQGQDQSPRPTNWPTDSSRWTTTTTMTTTKMITFTLSLLFESSACLHHHWLLLFLEITNKPVEETNKKRISQYTGTQRCYMLTLSTKTINFLSSTSSYAQSTIGTAFESNLVWIESKSWFDFNTYAGMGSLVLPRLPWSKAQWKHPYPWVEYARFAHLMHPVQLAHIEPSVADTDALPLSCYKDLWATEGISDPDLPNLNSSTIAASDATQCVEVDFNVI